MAQMKRSSSRLAYLHPALFALLPAVSLLAHNINEAPPSHGIRPALVSLLAGLALLLLLSAILKDVEEAALHTSLGLILFFSYGHVYFGLVSEGTGGLFRALGLGGNHRNLLLAWTAILGLGGFIIHRVVRLRGTIAQIFSIMAVVAILPPIFRIAAHEIELRQPWDGDGYQAPDPGPLNPAPTPDIYLIVLDGYPRSDVLRDLFGYDNSSFISYLEGQGFQIAGEARSNYMQTGLSIASTLNMDYLDRLSAELGHDSADRTPIARLIRSSAVRQYLEAQGYLTVSLSTGYRVTSWEDADHYLEAPTRATTTLERLMVETSGLILLQDLALRLNLPYSLPGYQAHRDRIRFAFEQLPAIPALPSPKFVFAHILLPHPPFVFAANGLPLPQDHPFTLLDGDAYLGTRSEYIAGYRHQLAYVERELERVLSAIQARSTRPPIILLQADHGSGLNLDWHSVEASDHRERMAILSAYLLPSKTGVTFEPQVSPVNSFRLILDNYFETRLGLLDDVSYYSTWAQPYLFEPVE